MSCSASCSRLDSVTLPLNDRTRIWTNRHAVNHDYAITLLGDIPLPAACQTDQNFLKVVAFWDPVHAVFDIQGTKPTPTIEGYQTLIHRNMRIIPSLHEPRPAYLPGHPPFWVQPPWSAHQHRSQERSSALGGSLNRRGTHRPASTPRKLAHAHSELLRHGQRLSRANTALDGSRKKTRGVTTHSCKTGESCQLSPEHVGHKQRVMPGVMPLRELFSGLFPYTSTRMGLNAKYGLRGGHIHRLREHTSLGGTRQGVTKHDQGRRSRKTLTTSYINNQDRGTPIQCSYRDHLGSYPSTMGIFQATYTGASSVEVHANTTSASDVHWDILG
ncbi:hypothetical protein CRG98_019171 [Punica granatum]|uniref:Uncharacterized protein n=1 Tax=Punica granatum TaxID=22663 RepID=A0A2I0JX39_PUNGR|nr:hypothetical protein CRG98_019171 [Punica granatum]